METADELTAAGASTESAGDVQFQPSGFLLELSLDWIVLRASENIHHLLCESHVTLVEEPLGRFVHAQALHDLRNLFSRLSGTTGIARAYGIRLTDEPDLVDVAFQLSGDRVLLEAVPSSGSFGECFGTVGGLVAGLATSHGQALLDNGARRMRALTGYDRVTLVCGERRAQSTRGQFPGEGAAGDGVPMIVADTHASPVPLFPAAGRDTAVGEALMRSCSLSALETLDREGVRACLRVPFEVDGIEGEFRCDNRVARKPNFELHAAAELFAQLFAMRMEIEELKNR